MVGSAAQGGAEGALVVVDPDAPQSRGRDWCLYRAIVLSYYRAIVGITETCNSRTTRLNPEEGAGSGAADWTWPVETHENHEMSALLD